MSKTVVIHVSDLDVPKGVNIDLESGVTNQTSTNSAKAINDDSSAKINETYAVIQEKMQDVQNNLSKGIELSTQNMEDLDRISQRAESLSQDSLQLNKQSRRVKNRIWREMLKSKTMMAITSMLLTIVLILFVINMAGGLGGSSKSE